MKSEKFCSDDCKVKFSTLKDFLNRNREKFGLFSMTEVCKLISTYTPEQRAELYDLTAYNDNVRTKCLEAKKERIRLEKELQILQTQKDFRDSLPNN
jgi:hypothetical protein